MKNNTFHICDISSYEDDFFEDYKNDTITIENIKDFGIEYLVEIPTLEDEPTTSDTLTKDVLKWSKLSELLEDFIYDVDYGMVDSDELTELIDEQTYLLFSDYAIIKKNKKGDGFTVIKHHEIENCLSTLNFNIGENDEFIDVDENISYSSKFHNVNTNFDEIRNFTDYIESIIENDFGHIFLTNIEEDLRYDTALITDKHYLFKEFPEFKKIEPTKNGIYYENNYDNLYFYIIRNLINNNPINVIFKTVVTKGNIKEKIKNKEKIIHKIYGGFLYIDNNKVVFKQLTAKELSESLNNIDSNTIYCGNDKSDVICGFDL